jgi:2-polyprenyl-3-methyl-5-hydroxy-6-metoxy-1,4-benzoquinol methylase
MSMSIDFGRTADDYAGHRAGFPRSFFERVYGAGIISRGAVVLDIGCRTGTLARGFAHRGHTVTGLDRSPEMLRKANEIDRREGVTRTRDGADASGQAPVSARAWSSLRSSDSTRACESC